MGVNIAVCDDDKRDASKLENMLLKVSAQTISCDVFTSGNKLLGYLKNNKESYEVFFLDIEMRGMNGIETAQCIRRSDQKALIIYITNHEDYVYDVFETLPFRFLRKPVENYSLLNGLPVLYSFSHNDYSKK